MCTSSTIDRPKSKSTSRDGPTKVRPRKKPDWKTFKGRIAAQIRKTREESGMSTKDAADRCGIPVSTFYHYENGTRTPSLEAMFGIADGLGVSVRDLFPPPLKK